MQQIDRLNVSPFVSLLLIRTESAAGEITHVREVLQDVRTVIESVDDGATRTVISVGQPGTRAGVTSGFLHYEEKARPTWLRGDPPGIFDYVNHAVVVSQKGELISICCTAKPLQDEVRRAIWNQDKGLKVVQELSLLDSKLLNAAVVGARARTLWLSGLHRRTAVKADNKILSGVNLVEALSPIGDQTYTFSAVRSVLDGSSGINSTVGVTPRKSALWTRPARTWDDFHDEVSRILDHLLGAVSRGDEEAAPIPVLAMPATPTDPVSVAYDMAVVPPEVMSDDPSGTGDPEAARIAYDVEFEVIPLTGPSLRAKVFDRGSEQGTIEVTVVVGTNGEAAHSVAIVQQVSPGLQTVVKACEQSDSLTVYYESSHVLSAGRLFQPQFRDQLFLTWSWEAFGGYAIDVEKPYHGRQVQFDQIGKDTSLFSWVVNEWAKPAAGGVCWLACDDGANEVADFVALEIPATGPATLCLIHVKGAHSDSPSRELSTSAFEVVVSQALKNLRSLERRNLHEVLEQGQANNTKRYCWKNGVPVADRTGMLKSLSALGANYEREVLIVQPSARKSEYQKVLDPKVTPKPGWFFRRAQLSTLLLEAEASCASTGARFRVIAQDS